MASPSRSSPRPIPPPWRRSSSSLASWRPRAITSAVAHALSPGPHRPPAQRRRRPGGGLPRRARPLRQRHGVPRRRCRRGLSRRRWSAARPRPTRRPARCRAPMRSRASAARCSIWSSGDPFADWEEVPGWREAAAREHRSASICSITSPTTSGAARCGSGRASTASCSASRSRSTSTSRARRPACSARR